MHSHLRVSKMAEDTKPVSSLSGTVDGMLSDSYKDRFKAEYAQVSIRYKKLKNFCDKIELAEVHKVGVAPEHDCPLSLLREQQKYMGRYLGCLEKRAIIENIIL